MRWFTIKDAITRLFFRRDAQPAGFPMPSEGSVLANITGRDSCRDGFHLLRRANYGAGNNAMFLGSQDQGRNFKQLPLPFSASAKEHGRQVGERQQVDPNVGNILFRSRSRAIPRTSAGSISTSAA